MKKVLLIAIVLCLPTLLFPQHVDENTALKVAKNLYLSVNSGKTKTNDLDLKIAYTRIERDTVVYYIIDFGNNLGYATIAADFASNPILSYCKEGTYGKGNKAYGPGYIWLMDNYRDQIFYIKRNQLNQTGENIKMWKKFKESPAFKENISEWGPLLQTTWGQDYSPSPYPTCPGYSQYCPSCPSGICEKMLTGCTSTALAQILKYWHFPQNGIGTHTTNDPDLPGGTITINYTNETYYYDDVNMPLDHASSEIAKLMFHIGVAVDMDWECGGSGASFFNTDVAIESHFNYSYDNVFAIRGYTPVGDWHNMLIESIKFGMPVLYHGATISLNAHDFVIDGYNDNTFMFHINWGWDEGCDDWYNMDALNNYNGNWNYAHMAVFYIQPNKTYCSGTTTLTQLNASFEDGSGSVVNYGNNSDCKWLIQPPGAGSISMNFTSFNTEETNDVVYIYNGPTTSSPLLASFSGDALPINSYSSTSGSMLIRFVSNGSVTKPGWSISYTSTLAPPANLIASTNNTGSVILSWTTNPGATHYQIWRNTSNSTNGAVVLGGGNWLTGSSYTDNTAAPGQSYWYFVKAATSSGGANASAFSAASNEGWRKLQTPDFTASVDTYCDKVRIQINPVTGATHYRVYRNSVNNPATATPLGSGWITQTTYDDFDPVTPDVNYFYWVKAAISASGDHPSDFATPMYGRRGILSVAPTSASAMDNNGNTVTNICEDNHIILKYTGGTQGTNATAIWYKGGCGNGTSIGSGQGLDYHPNSTTQYFVRFEGGCSNTSCAETPVITYKTKSIKPSDITSSDPICLGQTNTLAATGGSAGTGAVLKWYATGCGSGNPINQGPSINVSPTSNTTYYVRYEGDCNTTGCEAELVEVHTPSTAPVYAVPSPSNTICVGQSASLNYQGGSPGTGAVVKWYKTGCGTDYVNQGSPITVAPSETTNYFVRFENVCGITTCANTQVNVNPLPVLVLHPTHASCYGYANGAINLVVSSVIGFPSFLWSNGATTQNISNLTAGTYSVTVTMPTGCSATASQTITEPPELTTSTSVTHVDCHGQSTGSIDLTASGGTTPYSYSWSNGATTQDVQNLAAGTYTVTVTDMHNCINFTSAMVAQPAGPISCYLEGTNVTCKGGSNGSITTTVNGGTPPYTFEWSNGSTTQNLINLTAGIYYLTITDSKACAQISSLGITQPEEGLVLDGNITNVQCYGQTNGAIDLTVSGLGGTNTFIWSNGATTEDISNLAAGSYSVTVTNQNGCSKSSDYNVTQTAQMALSYDVQPASCPSCADGAINLTVSGGESPYSFNWNTGQTTEDLFNITVGLYSVTVTDSENCTAIITITVQQANCTFGFSAQENINITGLVHSYCAWGDYDNDGYLDLAICGAQNNEASVITRIYKNNSGTGFTVAPVTNLQGVSDGVVTWGDYDKDGYIDLLVSGYTGSGGKAYLYKNNAGIDFTQTEVLTSVYNSTADWGDYDNDGDLDILISGSGSGGLTIKIYKNNNGTFNEQSITLPPVAEGVAEWGDYDKDGDLDILLVGYGSGPQPVSKICRNDGNNNFTEMTSYNFTGVYNCSAAWGDYDNDGFLDIVLTGNTVIPGSGWPDQANNTTKIYKNNSGTSFSDMGNMGLPKLDYCSVAWGDYNNDGKSDILMLGRGQGQTGRIVSVYKNNGTAFSLAYSYTVGLLDGCGKWGDYNNDGNLDIFIIGHNSGPDVNTERTAKIIKNTSTCVNFPPFTPTNMAYAPAGQDVTFSWDKSQDFQTPQNAISYNLRLGNTPGGSEIVAPLANTSNGFRRIVKIGNTGLNNSWTINNLPYGNYYWSLQAIDNGFGASDFASEQSFAVCPPFSITGQPVSLSVCSGSGVSFTVSDNGSQLNHQWQVAVNGNWQDLEDNGSYSGAATNTLSIDPALVEMNNNLYRCVVSDDCGSLNSEAAHLIVHSPPVIIDQPVNDTVNIGDTAYFTVNVSGYNLFYHWAVYDDGLMVPIWYGGSPLFLGWTTNVLKVTDLALQDNGLMLVCMVSGGCGTLTNSEPATLFVNPPMSAGFQAGDTVICPGNSVSFTDLSTGNYTSRAWVFPGGSPAISSDPDPLVNYSASGTYDVKLLITNGVFSDSLVKENYILVENVPEVSVEAPFVCEGDFISFNIVTSEPVVSCVISGPGFGPVPCSTQIVATPSMTGLCTITLTFQNTCQLTTTAYLTVLPYAGPAGTIQGAPVISELPNSATYAIDPVTNSDGYIWNYTGSGVSITNNGSSAILNFGPDATSGILTVSAWNQCGVGSISLPFTITVNTQCIRLKSPNGGENWARGSQHQVRWTPSFNGSVKVQLYQGKTLKQTMTSNAGDTSYLWTISGSLPAANNYKIKVTHTPTVNCTDTSDANFSIYIPPTITLSSPNGYQVYKQGTTCYIYWSDNISENIKIELWKGASFNRSIAPSASGTSYSWPIPTDVPNGNDYRIKLMSVNDPNVFDYSNNYFSITSLPTITVTSPNGGESWTAGSERNINWNDNISENVKIELFKGNVFKLLITSSTPSSGSYSNWRIPVSTVAGSDYRIKITSVNSPAVKDSSNSNFTMNAGSFIWVSLPNGGQTYEKGSQQWIHWEDNISGNVKIELLKSGVVTKTIAASIPSVSPYQWTVPTDVAAENYYKIKITSIAVSSLYDQSNNYFNITDPQQLHVTYPVGGETFVAGSNVTITHDDLLNEMVKIELYKGGVLKTVISESAQSNAPFVWTIDPVTLQGSDYKIRITSLTNPAVYAQSPNNFTINTPPYIHLTVPNGGEQWRAGFRYYVTWQDNISEKVKIELWKGGVYNRTLNPSYNSNGSYPWYISTSQAVGTDYTIKIFSTTNGAIRDSSDAPFSILLAPTITIYKPTGGENWLVGNLDTIKWYLDFTENVKIDLYSGSSFLQNITPGTPNLGFYPWVVPNVPPANNYKIKITILNSYTISKYSNLFSISGLKSIEVKSDGETSLRLYPNPSSGELWLDISGEGKEEFNFRLFNLQGQLVYFEEFMAVLPEKRKITLVSLPDGFYFLDLMGEQVRLQTKIFIIP